MKKVIRIFVFAIALVLLMSPAVSAAIPYTTYTYDIYGYINWKKMKIRQNKN